MNHKYKVRNNDKPYFVTFTTVYWLDVFTRNAYRDAFLDSLRFCQQHKGLEVPFLPEASRFSHTGKGCTCSGQAANKRTLAQERHRRTPAPAET